MNIVNEILNIEVKNMIEAEIDALHRSIYTSEEVMIRFLTAKIKKLNEVIQNFNKFRY